MIIIITIMIILVIFMIFLITIIIIIYIYGVRRRHQSRESGGSESKAVRRSIFKSARRGGISSRVSFRFPSVSYLGIRLGNGPIRINTIPEKTDSCVGRRI